MLHGLQRITRRKHAETCSASHCIYTLSAITLFYRSNSIRVNVAVMGAWRMIGQADDFYPGECFMSGLELIVDCYLWTFFSFVSQFGYI